MESQLESNADIVDKIGMTWNGPTFLYCIVDEGLGPQVNLMPQERFTGPFVMGRWHKWAINWVVKNFNGRWALNKENISNPEIQFEKREIKEQSCK